ncbi:hypothetical protein HDU96_003906, partial [Phlyctochytrium bullatum]
MAGPIPALALPAPIASCSPKGTLKSTRSPKKQARERAGGKPGNKRTGARKHNAVKAPRAESTLDESAPASEPPTPPFEKFPSLSPPPTRTS